MIQKMSDQHTINFLFDQPDEIKPEEKKASGKQEVTPEDMKSRKLDHHDTMASSKSVASARTGTVSDIGGPSKQIKSVTGNSIWDSAPKNIPDTQSQTRQEKERVAENKRIAEKQRMDDLVEKLQSTDQRKASSASVSSLSPLGGSKFNLPQQGMSIFDQGDYERIPEKTAGEKVSEENEARRNQKDTSWKNSGRSFSSKDVVNRLFDAITEQEK